MSVPLVNGYYPKDYFDLPGVDQQAHPNELWWASQERAPVIDGLPTSEILEVDFGRVREINYLAMDIMKKPVNVQIFYDATSFDDGSHTWIEVSKLPDSAGGKFDSMISFDGTRNPWLHAEYYFTNSENSGVIATRFLRIVFSRRTDLWPSPAVTATIWSIDVANLRTARYITNLDDARGVLFGVNNTTSAFEFNGVDHFRQPFRMPSGYLRGDNGLLTPRDPVITPIVPNIVGFGFLVNVKLPGTSISGGITRVDSVSYEWEFWNLDTNKIIKRGVHEGATNPGKCWIDVLFDPRDPVPTTPDSNFEFRIKSLNREASDTVYINTPNTLGSDNLTDLYTHSIDFVGVETITRIDDSTLAYRIWADIGESGKDVLGNQYREGVRRDSATNAIDHESTTAWFSSACPDPQGVECLYFDVRSTNDEGNLVPSILDAIRVNPATPGPFMHIYYSNDGANESNQILPASIDDWEGLRWTPVPQTYVLDKNHTYDLPRPIRASWICLEFSNLQPMPYDLPEIPELPAVSYKTYPSWVRSLFDTNSTFKGNPNNIEDLGNGQQQVRGNLFTNSYSVVDEFTINNRIVDTQDDISVFGSSNVARLSPMTLAQITLTSPQSWTGNLASDVGTVGSVFAKYVSSIANQGGTNFPSEALPQPSAVPPIRNVSSLATAGDPSTLIPADPLYFDRVCRHTPQHGGYKVVLSKFNKKAYFVGITDVQFYRKDYTVKRDDPIIHDILADLDLLGSPLVEINTWTREIPSNIPSGTRIYVTYSINNVTYSDEVIQFEDADEDLDFGPVTLANNGGQATNLQVYDGPNQTGHGYILGTDYDIAYDPDTLTNSILRNALHYRLVATRQAVMGDAATITGYSFISGEEVHILLPESSTVASTSLISSIETFVGSGITTFNDVGTVIGSSFITAIDILPPRNYIDGATATSSFALPFTEIYSADTGFHFVDGAMVTGHSAISFAEVSSTSYLDSGTVARSSSMSTNEQYTRPGTPPILSAYVPIWGSDADIGVTAPLPALRPAFIPYMPKDVRSFVLSSMRAYLNCGPTTDGSISMAVYKYNYTGPGIYTATYVAQTNSVPVPQPGTTQDVVVALPMVGGPITLDFNYYKYMFAVMISGTNRALIRSAQNIVLSGTGNALLTTPTIDIDTWPSSIDQISAPHVQTYKNYPYIGLVNIEGERLI